MNEHMLNSAKLVIAAEYVALPRRVQALQWPLIDSISEGISAKGQPMRDFCPLFSDYWGGSRLICNGITHSKAGVLWGRMKGGPQEIMPGDWVIRDEHGRWSVMNHAEFTDSYEEARNG